MNSAHIYRWGYREVRASHKRRRIRRIVKLIVGVSFLLGVLAVLGLVASARPARGQTIGEPYCQISPPAMPAFTSPACLTPRVYLPEIQR